MKSKLQILLFFIFVVSANSFAGTTKPAVANITVYSEFGDKFRLYVAGVQQNNQPSAVVVAKEVRGSSVLLKIVFENNSIPVISKTVTRSATKDVIYAVSKDPKGNYFLKISSKVILPDTTIAVKPTEPIVTVAPISTLTAIPESNKDTVIQQKQTVTSEPKPSVTVTPTTVTATKPTSDVWINGQPAQTTVTTNSNGTPILKAENNTGSITIDPSKEYHSPTINGVPAKDFGDALGDAFDQTFNGKPSTARPQTTSIPPTATTPTVNTNTHPAAIGTATFYSETGEKFTLTFNGVQANSIPLSNVVVSNVSVIRFSANVVFQDSTIAPITKSMMRIGKDCTYTIKKNKKGEYILKLTSAVGAL